MCLKETLKHLPKMYKNVLSRNSSKLKKSKQPRCLKLKILKGSVELLVSVSRAGSREWAWVLEGMPGSADGGKNCGRACMVPGKMRSQSGGESMPLEEEGLFHTALSFTTVLAPSLMWACQVPGRMPIPPVTEGKLCFKNLQWHSNHWHQRSHLLLRQRSLRTAVERCTAFGPGAESEEERKKPLRRSKEALISNMDNEAFSTRKWTHLLFIHYKNKAWYGGKKMSFGIQMICAPSPALPLLPMSSRETVIRFYMCLPSLPRFLHSWAGNTGCVLGKGLWVGSWGIIFRLRFLRVALLSPSFSSLSQTGQRDHWHSLTRDKRAMTFMTFIRLCTREK